MSRCRTLTVTAILSLLTQATGSMAQDTAKPPSNPAAEAAHVVGAGETLKERLSDKASDDQRVDNCKVPVERRGAKQRPDSCAPAAREIAQGPDRI